MHVPAQAGMRTKSIPADGGGLKAAVLGRGTTTVVFANEGSSGPCPWLPLATRLASHGARELSRATRARHEIILVRTGHGLELLSGAAAAHVVPAVERFVFTR
jgi:hypothetical protein